METNATSPVTTTAVALRYGLLLTVSGILVDFLVRIAGFNFMTFGIASFLGGITVSIVWIVLAHRAFKRANGNLMTFGQGLTIAMIMMLITGFVSGLFNYLYVHYIDPEFVERMKAGMTEFMERNNVPDEQIETSTARLDGMNVGIGKALLGGLGNGLGFGLFLGLIVSAFTKKSKPEFE
ncbi:DUF4199 domain-containing protein [Hymenobacter antarcticus]|uniref:DUF4199 domain-containing protein n=1 Tax=Hymenobacter antarcticus TaxID=486270 RepID=A0ABP7QJ39_9BACT